MRVPKAEFISNFEDLLHRAESEPVTITVEERDLLVLMSLEEFERLNQGRAESDAASSAALSDPELPAAWGALRHAITFVADDIVEPTGEVWKVEL